MKEKNKTPVQNHIQSREKSSRTSERTFLQVRDAMVQGGERGLHSVPLLGVVPGGWSALLYRVDPGQNLLLHVVYLVLQQIFQAVRLHGAVPSTVLLHRTEGHTHW